MPPNKTGRGHTPLGIGSYATSPHPYCALGDFAVCGLFVATPHAEFSMHWLQDSGSYHEMHQSRIFDL